MADFKLKKENGEDDTGSIVGDHNSSNKLETLEEMDERFIREKDDLQIECDKLLKTAKKSTRKSIEAKIIQMQYDLKSKHMEEEDKLLALIDNEDTSTIETKLKK